MQPHDGATADESASDGVR